MRPNSRCGFCVKVNDHCASARAWQSAVGASCTGPATESASAEPAMRAASAPPSKTNEHGVSKALDAAVGIDGTGPSDGPARPACRLAPPALAGRRGPDTPRCRAGATTGARGAERWGAPGGFGSIVPPILAPAWPVPPLRPPLAPCRRPAPRESGPRGPRSPLRPRPRMVRGSGMAIVRVPGGGLGGIRPRRIGPAARAHRHGQDLCGLARAARPRVARLRGQCATARRALDHAAACAGERHRACARTRRTRAAAALDGRRAHRRHRGCRARTPGEAAAQRARHHAREPVAAAVARRLARALRPPRRRGRRRVARAPGKQARRAGRARARAPAQPAQPASGLGTVGDAGQSRRGARRTGRTARRAARAHRARPGAQARGDRHARPADDRALPVGGTHRPQAAAGGRRARSSAPAPRSCSPTCARRRRSGTRRCSKRGRTGRARSRCITARSSATCATGSRRACATASCARSCARRASTSASTSRRSTRCLQIGSPKGVARLLQRAGRSGHRPGEISRVTVLPTHALELVEAAAARDAARGRDGRAAPAAAADRSTCSCSTSSPARWAAASRPTRCATKCAARVPTRTLVRRGLALGARLRHARRSQPQRLPRVPARGDRRGRHRARARRGHRTAAPHVDRHDRLRSEHHGAHAQRRRARPRRGVVRRAAHARATPSSSPVACSSSCACAR